MNSARRWISPFHGHIMTSCRHHREPEDHIYIVYSSHQLLHHIGLYRLFSTTEHVSIVLLCEIMSSSDEDYGHFEVRRSSRVRTPAVQQHTFVSPLFDEIADFYCDGFHRVRSVEYSSQYNVIWSYSSKLPFSPYVGHFCLILSNAIVPLNPPFGVCIERAKRTQMT